MSVYTRFFSGTFKERGWPNDPEILRKVFNIAVLEARIEGINIYRKREKDGPNAHKYDLDYHRIDNLLCGLTQRMPPEKLFELWTRKGL